MAVGFWWKRLGGGAFAEEAVDTEPGQHPACFGAAAGAHVRIHPVSSSRSPFDQGCVGLVEALAEPGRGARRDPQQFAFLVDDGQQVAAEHGLFAVQIPEATEECADVLHRCAAVQLTVDARRQQCILGLEVPIQAPEPADRPAAASICETLVASKPRSLNSFIASVTSRSRVGVAAMNDLL